MTGRPALVLATGNPGKLAELTRILAESRVEVEVRGLADFPQAPRVVETGATFAENALLKARAIAAYTGLPAVADDSGLCVDALNGMPGVLSARWAGPDAGDAANLRLLLDQLRDVPEERRGAYFTCVAVLVFPAGEEHVRQGEMRGRIIAEPRGRGGFGYDPVFVPDGERRTTAELTAVEKDAISHRGKALRDLAPAIAAIAG